jgi:hypothetical protein
MGEHGGNPDSVEVPTESGALGVLLSRDLMFISKITGTARALGFQVLAAGNSALAASTIQERSPRVVFVDLAAGDLVSPTALIRYQQLAGPETRFIAFGSHVDVQALAAAREAGCHLVMPRSKFSAELPELITRYFQMNSPAS